MVHKNLIVQYKKENLKSTAQNHYQLVDTENKNNKALAPIKHKYVVQPLSE